MSQIITQYACAHAHTHISSAWFQNIVSAYFIDFHFFMHSDRSRSALSNGEVFKFPLLTVKELLNFENNRI